MWCFSFFYLCLSYWCVKVHSRFRCFVYQDGIKQLAYTHVAPLGLKSGGAPCNYRHVAPLGLRYLIMNMNAILSAQSV